MFQSYQIWLFLKVALLFELMQSTLCCTIPGCSCRNTSDSLMIDSCNDFNPQNCSEMLKSEKFIETLNEILITNSLIQHLEVRKAPMWKIPEQVCNLKELRELRFSENCLSDLPSTCFRRLSNLESIHITDNKVQILPRDLLSGLNKLKIISFTSNKIKDIDDDLFSNVSNSKYLETVDISDNRLTSISPWPLMRGLSKPGFKADLSTNMISSFKNNVGWRFNCTEVRILAKMSHLSFDINLRDNNVRHLTDLVDAFFGAQVNVICLFGPKSHTNVTINLEENTFSCDCQDYSVHKYFRTFTRMALLNDARCFEPLKLRNKRLYEVALEELICDFTNTKSCIEECKCIFRPHGKLFIVDCSHLSTPLTSLPFSVVPLKNISKMSGMKYNFIFTTNEISNLEKREYFEYTSLLDLSGTQLKTINRDTVQSLKDVDFLYLNDNLLETLPVTVTNVNWTFKQIKLHGNPWRCDCENVWLKSWLISMQPRIATIKSIYCSSPRWLVGKVIVKVEDHEFCENPEEKQRNHILIGSFVSAASVLVLAIAAFTLMKKFKVELHCYLNVHPFDKDECKGENMIYDAFISSSYSDRLFAIPLVRLLESKGYRVCYHEKDFIGGQTIVENICQAILNSKRVVCFITKAFIESNYCMYEFQKALHQNIMTKRRRLIALIDDDLVINQSTLPDDVYQFLTTHTYIEIKSNNNWERHLFYSLAVNKLGSQPTNN